MAPGLSGLASIDEHGGRLLLFPDDGRLLTFTGERVGRHDDGHVAGLAMTLAPAGALDLTYEGPMLVFPDTTPFVDLERGLATAGATPARVTLQLTPAHAGPDEPCAFGLVRGEARLGDVRHPVAGHAVRSRREVGLAARSRVALRLADGTVIVARGSDGTMCRGGVHVPVERCAVRDDGASAHVRCETGDGATLERELPIIHRLPVVPGVPGAGGIVFASCRDEDEPAGWLTFRSG